MENKTNTLGGFEAIFDSFIPKVDDEIIDNIDNENIDESFEDDDLENIKKNQVDPIADKVKKSVSKDTEKKDDKSDDTEEDIEDIKEDKEELNKKEKTNDIDEDIEKSSESNEEEIVSGFFDAIAEKLGWEFEENEEKPKDVDSLIDYFQNVIEQNSKPEYASEEIENLDNFVKQGGNLRDFLSIDAGLDLDNIDIENEDIQKQVVRELLNEKGFNKNKIEKTISRYEDAGLLEDEAQDALEDLKEIREQKKEKLLQEQKKAYEQYQKQQQEFYINVVDEIKSLKNIRGIAIPEKDKKDLIEYIFKPDTDGKTKYQKDYAKGGIKNLIESAYFTKNADKLIEAAKKEGNNSAIDKFKRSLKSTSVNTKSKQTPRSSSSDTIWDSFTKRLRIS